MPDPEDVKSPGGLEMGELADVVELHHKAVELPEEPDLEELEVSNMMSWEALHYGYDIRDLAGGDGPCPDQVVVRTGRQLHQL